MSGLDILTINDTPGHYPASYYHGSANKITPSPTAKGDLRCDVCVIGGGFTGLSAALHLSQQGLDVILLEANRVGWGASGRNGGQVGTGQRLDQPDLEKMVGKTRARTLWDLSLDSVSLVKDLIQAHKIDCGFMPGIIHADHRARFVADSHAYAEKLNRDYGYDQAVPLTKSEIRDHVGSNAYFGGVLDLGGGHIHPLNFALGLAHAAKGAGVRIFENTRVKAVQQGDPATATTDQASVSSRFVVMGCNGYLGDINPAIGRRVMPINNFIVATEPLPDALAKSLIRDNHAVADSRFVVNYFRLSQDNRLLFGGGETYGYRFPKDIRALVRKPMLKIYPQLTDMPLEYAWGGTLAITMNRMPHFTRSSANILSASGYSGHGVAMATLAGKAMAEAINGQAKTFDVMASVPGMAFPGGATLRWPLLVLAMTWYGLRDRL